ncbi:hypothetical protein [Modestobacter altitudinis]|nr:hypothetical protein [Modestobacter altitudinis]
MSRPAPAVRASYAEETAAARQTSNPAERWLLTSTVGRLTIR